MLNHSQLLWFNATKPQPYTIMELPSGDLILIFFVSTAFCPEYRFASSMATIDSNFQQLPARYLKVVSRKTKGMCQSVDAGSLKARDDYKYWK